MAEPFNWRDVIQADLEALPTAKDPVRTDDLTTQVVLRAPIGQKLIEQAEKRGVSRASYVKRAVMAMLALDLGVRLSTLTAVDPKVVRGTGFPIQDERGTAFGPWELEGFAGE